MLVNHNLDHSGIHFDINNLAYQELIGMLVKFMDERDTYHVYNVDRLGIQSILVGYDYYYRVQDTTHIEKYVVLGDFGTLEFIIDLVNNRATITEESVEVIEEFLMYNGFGVGEGG